MVNQKNMPLPEKITRNKAIVALTICGFSQHQIADLLRIKRGNLPKFIKKYTPRYMPQLTLMMVAYLLKGQKLKNKK